MSLDEKFEEAATQVKQLAKSPYDDDLLKLYGLYKQATVGDVNTPRPGMIDFKGKAKWDAWNQNSGMSKDKAKEEYVLFVTELIKTFGKK